MKDTRVYIIFGVVAVILLFFFVYASQTKTRFNWNETYLEESKEPYGTYVSYQLLQNYFPNETFHRIDNKVRQDLPARTNQKATYFFVGEGLYLDTIDTNRLLSFVESGNDAFISSKSIPYDLMFYVYYEICNDYFWEDYEIRRDSNAYLNFVHEDLNVDKGYEYRFLQRNQPKPYAWHYIDSIFFCQDTFSLIELGTIKDSLINFAKIDYGEGTFYFHSTPLAFTNVQLLDKTGINYLEGVLSHLKAGDIYWDAHSRVNESVSRQRNNRMNTGGGRNLREESPLKYVLAQPALAWAWYTMLGLVLLYILFRAKRRQRVIPVLEKNTNTSMEFLSTIGSLYFLHNDHKKMSIQKMKLFLSFIREHYHLPTNELDDHFRDRLAARSEIPRTIIDKILLYYTNIKTSTFVSEQTLIDLHLEIDKFYKNCK